LFTLFKVAGGPSAKNPLKRIRITRGKYFASGKTFKIIDDWTTRANAHRLLEGLWIDSTDFREVAEYIDDDSDEEIIEAATTTTTTTTTIGPVVEDKTEEIKIEESTKGSRPVVATTGPGEARIAYLDTPPGKDRHAQPSGELARKHLKVPPAELLSLQGRLGAPRFSAVRSPTDALQWHASVGESKEVLKSKTSYGHAGRLWTRHRGNRASRTVQLRRTPRYQVQGDKGSACPTLRSLL
jgi:hypothetical protein